MTLEHILEQITTIEENPELSRKNYLKSLQYISNLYNFRYLAEGIIDFDAVEFLPSFIDCYICEELGIPSFTEESELRYVRILFNESLEDEEKDEITRGLSTLCNMIEWETSRLLNCYLKNFRQKGRQNENKVIIK